MAFSQPIDFSSLFCSPQQVTATTAPHGNIGYPWLPSGSVVNTSNPASTGSNANRNATNSSNELRLSNSGMLDACVQQAAEDDAYYMAIATRICKDVSAMDDDDDDDAVPSFLPPPSTTTTEEHDHDLLSKNPSNLRRGGSAQSTNAVVVGSGCTSFTTDASGGICTGGTHHGKNTNGALLSADRPNQTADGSDVLGSGGSPPTSHSPRGTATKNTVVQSLSVQALAQRQQTGTNSQGSSIGSQANNNNVFRDKPKGTSQGVSSTTGNSSATMGGGGGTNANHPISYGVAHQANQPQPHVFNTAPPNPYASNGNGNHHQKHFNSGGQNPGVMPGPHLGMATRAVMPQPPPSPPQLPPTVTPGTGSSVVPNGSGSYGALLASANPPSGSTAHLLQANGMSPSQQQGPPMPGVAKNLTDHNPNHTSAMPMAVTTAGSALDRNPIHKPSNHVNPSTVNVNSSGSTNPQQQQPILYNPQLQTQSAMAARMVPAATVQQQQSVLLRTTTATPRSPMYAAATPMQAPPAQQHHQQPQPQIQQQTTQVMSMPGVAPMSVMTAGASGHIGNSVAQPPQQYYVLQQPTQQQVFAISQQQPQQIVLVTPQQQQQQQQHQQQRQHLSMQVMTAGGTPGATYPTPGGASMNNNHVNRVIMVGGRPYVLPPGASAAVDASGRLIFVANAPAGNPTSNVVNTTNVGNANGAPAMMMPPSHASMALTGGSGGMHGVPLTHGGGSPAPSAMSGGSIVGMPQDLAWGGLSSMSFQQGPTQQQPPPPASMPAQQAVLIGLPHGATPQQTPFMISQPMQQWWPQP